MGRFTYEEIDEGEGTSDIVTYDSSRQDFGNHIYTENTTTFHPPIHHHPSDELDEGIASTVPYSSIMSPTSYHNRHDRIPQSICTQFGDDQTLNPTSNVYRSDDDFGEANRQRSNFNYYIKHGCIILIMLLLQHYIPPPPPPNHSWRDFVSNSTESFVTTVQSVIALTAYISSGCVHNIYGDVKTVISSAFTHNYHHHHHHTDTDTELSGNQGNNCRLFIPLEGSSSNVISDGTPNNNSINNSHLGENTNNDEDLVEYLLKTIHGQKEAINNTVKKLYQWNDKKKRQPLSILLTGSNGVGKYKTASQLAHYFLSQCGSNDNGEYYSPLSNGLLILSGLDYALENDLNQKDDLICHHQDIVPKILNYLYKRNGAPAVILIKHVENIAHSQQLELFRLWKQSKVKFQPVEMINKKSLKHDQGWRSLNQYANVDEGEETFVEINLENVAFIATSDEGTNKLFEVISKSDGIHDDMLYEEVNKSVQHEVNKVFGESIFDIVTPFWPLRYWDLEKIIINMMQHNLVKRKFRKIEVQDSAAKHLVEPKAIDYFELRLSEGIYMFAKNGAHDLVKYYSILDDIDAKIISNSYFNENETVLLAHENGKGLSMKLCNVWNEKQEICSQNWYLVS